LDHSQAPPHINDLARMTYSVNTLAAIERRYWALIIVHNFFVSCMISWFSMGIHYLSDLFCSFRSPSLVHRFAIPLFSSTFNSCEIFLGKMASIKEVQEIPTPTGLTPFLVPSDIFESIWLCFLAFCSRH